MCVFAFACTCKPRLLLFLLLLFYTSILASDASIAISEREPTITSGNGGRLCRGGGELRDTRGKKRGFCDLKCDFKFLHIAFLHHSALLSVSPPLCVLVGSLATAAGNISTSPATKRSCHTPTVTQKKKTFFFFSFLYTQDIGTKMAARGSRTRVTVIEGFHTFGGIHPSPAYLRRRLQ